MQKISLFTGAIVSGNKQVGLYNQAALPALLEQQFAPKNTRLSVWSIDPKLIWARFIWIISKLVE